MKYLKFQFFKEKIFWLFILLIIVIIFVVYKPHKPQVTLDLIDNCGKSLNNAISHTIPADSICLAECLNYCKTIDMEYKSHKFVVHVEQCNECSCICR